MRPLVAVRRAAAYDPAFVERSPLLWPIAPAAQRLGARDDFPSAEELTRAFEGLVPVRFVSATPAPRRGRRGAVDVRSMYDARITLDRCVPTRARCWHDLMNALVWATFPRAKLEVHARQHRAIAARVAPGARTLPPSRTRELDALALVDEGGVVVLARRVEETREALRAGALRDRVARGEAEAVVFGHAIFESLVLGVTPAAVAAIVLPRGEDDDPVRAADAALAAAISDATRLLGPEELRRVDVRDAARI